MSPEHLHHYVNEIAGRHNRIPEDTIDRMLRMAAGLVVDPLPYRLLAAALRAA